MLGVALALAGCSSELDRDDLVEAYAASDAEPSDTQAACVIDALLDGYTVGEIEVAIEADPVDADFVLDRYRAEFGCGMTDDARDQLADLMVDDVDEDKVDCVADTLVETMTQADLEVLIEDEMTDEFFSRYFQARSDCDALPGQ